MKIFVLYTTDAWLSYNSRDIIAICTTFKNAIKLAKQHARQEDDNPLSKYEIDFLIEHYQTQGRDTNYYIEELDKNTLI